MSKTAQGYNIIDIDELKELSALLKNCIYADDFISLPKTEQEKIYSFCKCHATNACCKYNLKQIRYAITRQYFGY